MQRTPGSGVEGLHVAIVLDGNGRWAEARGLPRSAGHRAGARAVRCLAPAALEHGIGTLTLYAFSSGNWARPRAEVAALMGLFERSLLAEASRCRERGVRLSVIGRRQRLPSGLRAAVAAAERSTAGGRRLLLRIAIDYSARQAILDALALAVAGPATLDTRRFSRLLARAIHAPDGAPDVDLLIRTGGERRLSDFLLWECAYAELYFTDGLWPDFGAADLARALDDFRGRQRRFGALPAAGPWLAREETLHP